MYLSSIKLNTASRMTMQALASPAMFHCAVEYSFPGSREGKRRLWRIDTLKGNKYLLLLSEDKPDLNKLADKYGFSNDYATKSYDKLLDNIEEGNLFRFRLTANPTYSKSTGNKDERGKVHAYKTESDQREWLIKKGEQLGFCVSNEDFEITEAYMRKFNKRRDRSSPTVILMSVTYEGTLKVTNKELFKKALCDGIGREKAYGMGLLTIMRIKND